MITHLRAGSLTLGPTLLAASTPFWEDGRYGTTGGVLVALSSITWAYGLLGGWEHIATRLPKLATAGVLLTLLGTLGGIAFGLQGFFEGIFGVSGAQSLAATAAHPVTSWLVLWAPGPMFPASLVLLGAGLLRTDLVPRPLAVTLMLGGLAFPVSRISRIDLIAHGVDAVLLAASAWLAVLVLGGLFTARERRSW